MKGNDDIGLESMITDANFFVEVNQSSALFSNKLLCAGIIRLVSARRSGEWVWRGNQLTGFILKIMFEERAAGGDGSNMFLRANPAWMTWWTSTQWRPSRCRPDSLLIVMFCLEVSPWSKHWQTNANVVQAGQPNHMVFWISMELSQGVCS